MKGLLPHIFGHLGVTCVTPLRCSSEPRFLSLSLAATAVAQTNTFDLQSGSRSLGRASFTLAKARQGFKLSSRLSYHINGVESDICKEFNFSDAYSCFEGGSSSISSQMHTSNVPNKPRTDLVIGIVPGGAQVMLLLATTHPSERNLCNIVVPGFTSRRPRRERSVTRPVRS